MKKDLQISAIGDLRPRLTVIGVGGAGGNAVNNMISSGLSGVTFAVANTDAQSLASSSAEHRIQLGATLTEGLGAGARPEIGEAAAEEAVEEIRAQVAGSHMVFIAAGMGGGTGTGAAAVIAKIAREAGALTVGVVTKPFQFEGSRRMRAAETGIAAMKPVVDTLIVIPNQNLFRIANEKTTFSEAFVLADHVLYAGIACIVDLIVKDGLINLDFADVRSIMAGMGTAMMGTGEASGDRRAVLAAEEAISNPLLDDTSLRGARGLLISITGGSDLTLYEVDEAANRVRQEVDAEANIIVGATFDDTIGDRIRVSIVASGMERLGQSENWQPQQPAADAFAESLRVKSAVSDAEHPPLSAGQQSADDEPAQPSSQQVPGHQHYQPASQHPMPEPHAAAPMPGSTGTPQPDHWQPQPTGLAHTDALPAPMPTAGQPAQAMPPPPTGYPASETQLAGGQRSYRQPDQPRDIRPSWTSDGGAVFEDAPPPFGAPHDHAPSLDPHREPLATLTPRPTDPSFSPQPPAEARRGQRRLPDVDDFPAIGQREYRAKIEQYDETLRPAPRAYTPPAPVEPPRKLGFFERLTGGRRREAAKQAKAAAERKEQKALSRTSESQNPRASSKSYDDRLENRQEEHEDTELPVFFGTDKK